MNPDTAARRRERHRHEARQAILTAADGLLAEDGYEQFSMRRLAGRCGFTAATIYHYFSDKTGLLDQLLDSTVHQLNAEIEEAASGQEPVESLRQMLLTFVRFGMKQPHHYHLLAFRREATRPPLPALERTQAIFTAHARAIRGESLPGDTEKETTEQQALWALVHGLITIRQMLPEHPWNPDLDDVAIDGILGVFTRAPRGATC